MNKIVYSILHWLGVIIATLVILLAVMLSLLHLFDPYLERHHAEMETLVSQFMQQPVSAGKISITGHGLEPVLQLQNVVIFNDARTTELFKVREVRVGFDLVGSLLHRKIELGLLAVSGIKLSVHQDATGIRIGELTKATTSNSPLPVGLSDMLEWLFTQGSIRLSEVDVEWYNNDQKFTITNLGLYLTNGVLQHDLTLTGKFMQSGLKNPAKFNFKLGLKGDILKQEKIVVSGFAEIDDAILNFYSNSQNSFFPNISFDGDIELYLANTKLTINKVFRQPIIVKDFNGRVKWQHRADGFAVQINSFNLHSDSLVLNGDVQLTLPQEGDAIIDSLVKFQLTKIAQAKMFYPVNVLHGRVLSWLDQAFAGRKVSGNMILKGPLAVFPFDHGEGKFLITTDLKSINLDYAPGWPRIEDIHGKLIFSGRSMHVIADTAKIMDIPLKHIAAVIPDLDRAVLQVNGNVTALANQGLRFVYASPVRNIIGHELQGVNLSGLINLRLKLLLPLSEDDASNVIDGNLTFQKNNLSVSPAIPALKNLQGMLHFTADDFVATNVKAEIFNRLVGINISTEHHGASLVKIDLAGNLALTDLYAVTPIPFASQISGETAYHAEARFYSGNERKNDVLKVTTNLQGVNLALPDPLGKTANEVRDFTAALYFGDRNYQKLVLNFGDSTNDDFFTASINFKLKELALKINKFNWADWEKYLLQVDGVSAFNRITCDVGQLITSAMIFPEVKLNIVADGQHSVVSISSPKITGELIIPHDLKEAAITGTLEKFNLDKTAGSAKLRVENIVPMNLQVNDFYYDHKSFGKVLLEVKPQDSTILINRFDVINPDFTLNASGKWESLGRERTTLQGSISSKDIGSASSKFGLDTNLVGGKGGAGYTLSWVGAPDQISLKTLEGNIALKIENGRTTNLSKQTENEIQVVRILNILSLPTLPRHLTLDFSDFTKTGFVFDMLKGELKIKDGSIFTTNTNLTGPVADIFITGRIGVVVQDYDLDLIVIPHLTSSVPIIATITGGPIVGLVTFLGDKLLKTGVQQVMSYGYYVHGSRDKPIVEKLSMGQLSKVLRER